MKSNNMLRKDLFELKRRQEETQQWFETIMGEYPELVEMYEDDVQDIQRDYDNIISGIINLINFVSINKEIS